jgi:protein arginine N-methyltransferase 5
LKTSGEKGTSEATASRADPILLPLTPEDTSVFPSQAVNTYVAYTSPWIDLCSNDPVIANISRQVLNLEVNYASWCGVKSIIIAGPGRDASKDGGNRGLAQYSRAVKEALTIAPSTTILIHIPMYREPPVGAQIETLSSLNGEEASKDLEGSIDIFTSWDSWNQIRSVCNYNHRLLVGKQMIVFLRLLASSCCCSFISFCSLADSDSHSTEGAESYAGEGFAKPLVL